MILESLHEHDKKRMRLRFDTGEELLLYKGELRKLRLAEGDELPEETYQSLLQEVLIPRAKRRVLYYLKSGDRSEAEIRRKLREGRYPEEAVEESIRFLKQHRLVDDRRYAEELVYVKTGSCSRKELAFKLRQKGISDAVIKESVEAVGRETEYETCRKLLSKRLSGKPVPDPELAETPEERELLGKEKQKLYAWLLRKGFPYDAAEYAMNHIGQ